MITRARWTPEEDAILAREYPDRPTADLEAMLPGRTVRAIYARATEQGLRKSTAFLQSDASGRMQKGKALGAEYRFTPGQVPPNKGLRRPGWGPGRMKETQFKQGVRGGVAARLYQPIGTERITEDGYRQRKVNDDRPFHRRWRFVHVLVWEAAHGPVPKGSAIVFRDGDRLNCALENLAQVSRKDLMSRNSVHNYPDPIPQLVQLRGALVRKINGRTKEKSA